MAKWINKAYKHIAIAMILASGSMVFALKPTSQMTIMDRDNYPSYTDGLHPYKNGLTYWVRVGGTFKVYVDSYINKVASGGNYPTMNYLQLRDNTINTAYINSTKYDGSLHHTVTGADSFYDNFVAGTTSKHWRGETTNMYYLMNHYEMAAKHNGKTYSVYTRSVFNGDYEAYKQAGGVQIKTDGVKPSVDFINENIEWQRANSYVLRTSASDSESGLRRFKYYMTGADATPNWQWTNERNFTIDKQGITNVSILAEDNVGNYQQKNTYVALDNVKPTTTISGTSETWFNSNRSITISAVDTVVGSGVNTIQYKLNNSGTWVTYPGTSLTISADGITKIEARSIDKAGNISDTVSGNIKIDKTLPTVAINGSVDSWINTNGSFTITGADQSGKSGLNRLEYKLNNSSTWVSYPGSAVTISAEGITKIDARAVDNAGNISYISTKNIRIDKTKPTVSIGGNINTWTNTNGSFTITGADQADKSGINRFEYKLNNSATWVKYPGSAISISTEGTTKIEARSIDNAGNISAVVTANMMIDKTKPTVAISGSINSWINTNGSFTITGADAGSNSGLNRLEYKLNNSATWLTYPGSAITISAEGITKIEARAVDNAGNTSVISSANIMIDKTKPTSTVSTPSTTNSTTINVSLKNTVEVHSGVKTLVISTNSSFTGNNVKQFDITNNPNAVSQFKLEVKGTAAEHYTKRTIYVKLIDTVGNYSVYEISTTIVPKAPQKPIITQPGNDQLFVKNESFNAQWTYTDSNTELPLPLLKTIVEIVNKDTGETNRIELIGNSTQYAANSFKTGTYSIKVTVFNWENISSTSDEVIFKYNKFKENGVVRSVEIAPNANIRYLAIDTISEIPKGTEITGKIYYKKLANNKLDYSESIPFVIENLPLRKRIIKLPSVTDKIVVEYTLKRLPGNNTETISPALDHLIVYAK